MRRFGDWYEVVTDQTNERAFIRVRGKVVQEWTVDADLCGLWGEDAIGEKLDFSAKD